MKRTGWALGILLLTVTALHAGESAPAASAAPEPALDYFLIVTGSELLRGIYPDRHTHFITGVMTPLGGHCVGSWSVDDSAPDLTETLRYATTKAPVVLVTGGLGPTDDDITRETIAAFTGIALVEDPDVVAEMERRYRTPRDRLRANLRRQALVPARGGHLRNPHGSAVGLIFTTRSNTVIALPGPPRELHPMLTNEVVPYLQKHFALRTAGASRTLRFVGIGQSAIYQALHGEIAVEPDVVLTSQFEGERVDVTFSLAGRSERDWARLDAIEARVRRFLGDHIYANDGASLEEVVVRALKARGARLIVLDAATGGQFHATLSLARDAAAVLHGGIAASNEAGLKRALCGGTSASADSGDSPDRLDRLVQATREAVDDPACSVLILGEPRSTASGEQTLPLVWAHGAAKPRVEEVRGSGASEASRARIITEVLNRLRQRWLGAETAPAGDR
jgi:nicotinamide-nucleotide amidase